MLKATAIVSDSDHSVWQQVTWPTVCFSYALSGGSALIYEITWARMLQHFFGATVFAVSANLAIFMAGLALGAYIAGNISSGTGNKVKGRSWIRAEILRFAGNDRKTAEDGNTSLKVYAWLQLFTAATAMATTCIFSDDRLGRVIALMGLPFVPAMFFGFVLAAAVLIVPCTLIGATAPALAGFVKANSSHAAKDLSYLYAINIAGAVTGIVCGAFLLLPNLGLTASIMVAAALNLLCFGAISFVAARADRKRELTCPDEVVAVVKRTLSPATAKLIVILLLSGIISFVLQVVWSRLFTLVLGTSTYSFSIVLLSYLLGLFVGAWLSAHWLQKITAPFKSLAVLHLLAGAFVYAGTFAFAKLPWLCIYYQQIATQIAPHSFALILFVRLLLILPFIFLPACCLGAVLPMAFACFSGQNESLTKAIGYLYAASTFGAVCGALLSGFVLIPYFCSTFTYGLETICIFAAWCEIILAAMIFLLSLPNTKRTYWLSLATGVSALVLLNPMIIYRPFWNPAVITSGGSVYFATSFKNMSYKQFLKALSIADERKAPANLFYYRDGLNSTITVSKDRYANLIYLKTNGKVDAQLPFDPQKPSPDNELTTNVLLAQLPALLQLGNRQKAFIIGYGSGTTCGSLLKSPHVERVTVAELEPAVVAADVYFRPTNGSPLASKFTESGRLKLALQDGRTYLSTHKDRYDIIVSQAEECSVSGVSDLYTSEFYRLVSDKLAPNGMFCQWIQLYSITPKYLGVICRTFQRVFPYTYVFYPKNSAEIILLAANKPWAIDAHLLELRRQEPEIRTDLDRIGLKSDADILQLMVKTPSQFAHFCDYLGAKTGDKRIMTDDNLLTEYQLPKELYSSSGIVPENLQAITSNTY